MWRFLVLALFLALAGCSEPPPAPIFHSTDITGAEFGRSLAGLKDHRGKPATLADFQGKAVVVFFGYTSCPDVCPTTLARFASVLKQLGAEAERVQVLLVSVDPERDTPEKLAAYMPSFHPSFIGLYGDMPATEAVAKEFKVFFARSKAGASNGHAHNHDHGQAQPTENYMIDHSTGSYVFDPTGKVRLYVKDDTSVEAIVQDLKLLLAAK